MIQPRVATGLCAKCQRALARTIKRARNLALIPHIQTFDVEDHTRDLSEYSRPGRFVRIYKKDGSFSDVKPKVLDVTREFL
jgi:hypothetical protein